MYEGVTIAVQIKDGESDGFDVKAAVHHGSVLSPLLFITAMEALSSELHAGLHGSCFMQMICVCLHRGGFGGEK
jgi:hypothetical protein